MSNLFFHPGPPVSSPHGEKVETPNLDDVRPKGVIHRAKFFSTRAPPVSSPHGEKVETFLP